MKEILHKNLVVKGLKLTNFINLDEARSEMVRRWRNDIRIRRSFLNNREVPPQDHKNFVESLRNREDSAYWLVSKGERHLGVVYLTDIRIKDRNAFLGLYVRPSLIGKGYGRVLLTALLKLSFRVMNLHSLKLTVLETNKPAIKLYRSFGFKPEGKLREYLYRDGKWIDLIFMGRINPREVESHYGNRRI